MRRVSVSLLLLLLMQALSPLTIQAEEPDAKAASQEEIKQRLRKIQIGKETTRIEGPLDAAGNVDYLAAMNTRLSDGVTPEKNAAVELWMAAGPDYWTLLDVDSRKYFAAIGIRRFPSYDPFLVDWDDFALPTSEESPEEEEDALAERQEQSFELERQLLQATLRPWTGEQFPQVGKWLDRNVKPLQHIEQAVERERFYEPIGWQAELHEFGILEIAEPTLEVAITASNLLAARAMRRLGAGDLQGCAEDAYRLHRLGALVCQSPTCSGWQRGSEIRLDACQVSRALADSSAATSEFLLAHLAKLDDVPQDPYLVDRYDYFERLICLAIMEEVIRTARKDAFDNTNPRNRDLAKVFDAAFGNHFMDWNEPLRIANQFFDQSTAALQKPTIKETHAALVAVNREFYQWTGEDEVEQPNLLLQIFQQRSIGKALGSGVAKQLLDEYFVPAYDYFDTKQELRKELDMTKIVLAAAAFQRDNGNYPHSLATLSPRYLPQVLIDADNGQPYQIRMSIVSLGIDGTDDDVNQGYDDLEVRLPVPPAK